MKITIPFGEYLPDLPVYQNPGATQAKNVLPSARGYLPWPAQSAYSAALDARNRGAFSAKDKDSVVSVYAGDAAKLYSLDGTSWTDVSKSGSPAYALDTEENWEFAKWGETVIACSGVNGAATNNIQQITLGAAQFADLAGTPPQARHIAVVRDQVVVGNTWDSTDGNVPNRVRWCGIEDETAWTVSATTQADFQDLQGQGGWVQRVVGGEYGLVFQERSVWRMTYVGSPIVYQFDEILPGRGTPCPGSVIRVGDYVFFLSQEGFEVIRDGTNSEHIGAQKIDRTFLRDFDSEYWYRVTASYDPIAHRVYWAYPGSGATAGDPDTILCFDWSTGRWSYSEQEMQQIFVASATGTTLDALDAAIISGRAEQVTNGAFATDSDWTKGAGWTIGSGTASHAAGTASELSQDISAATGTGYYLTFTVSGRTAGSVTADIGGTDGTARSTNATFSETIHCGSDDTAIAFTATSDFDGDIDNVSVKSASIDAMSESLDSRTWKGGSEQVASFDSNNALSFWSGSNQTGVLETGEGELTPGMRTRVRELRAQADGGSHTVQIGTRDALSDAVAWSGAASPNSRGRVTRRSNARYHRFRVSVSGDFDNVTGIDIEASKGGSR